MWYIEVEKACVGKTVVYLTMEDNLKHTRNLTKLVNLL